MRPADPVATAAHLATDAWRDAVVPFLLEFGTIPDLSPAYDPGWEAAGELDRAAGLMADWAGRPRPARGHRRGGAARPG